MAYPQPTSHAPRVIEAMWRAAGVNAADRQAGGRAPRRRRAPAGDRPTLPLASVIADINKY